MTNVVTSPSLIDQKQEDPPHAHTATTPADLATSSLSHPGDWNAAYDHTSQKWYYYNSKTRERSWDPPPDWVSNGTPEAAIPTTAPTATTSLDKKTGYYYKDAHGLDQGPFSIHQLLQWRSALPMDLPLWKTDEENKEENNDEKGAEDGDEANFEKPRLPRTTITLAEVLGDTELRSQWRAAHPEITETTCAAPSATDFEKEIERHNTALKIEEKETHDDDILNNNDSSLDFAASLAQAVIAGLPPDDEAVHLSRVAASAGQSLHEVVEWSRKQITAAEEGYTVTAVHTAGRGRIQAVDKGEGGSLYDDMGSWIDPKKMEEQMKKANTGAKRKLTSAEVKAVKMKRQEIKEKKQRAWLME